MTTDTADQGDLMATDVAWDLEELVDGAAWWVADDLAVAMPLQLSGRNVGWR